MDFIQPVGGYRFSEDSILLANYLVSLMKNRSRGNGDILRVLEIGAGCGVISILLADAVEHLLIEAYEVQRELFDIAGLNVKTWLLEDRIKLYHTNIMSVGSTSGCFDLIFSNPPYFPVGSGRVSENRSRMIARHEQLLDMHMIVSVARRGIAVDGLFCVIYPLIRQAELAFEIDRASLDLLDITVIAKKWFIALIGKKATVDTKKWPCHQHELMT